MFPKGSGFILEERTMRFGRLFLVLVVLFLSASVTAHAYEVEVLHGLKGICVAIAPVSPDLEELGLSTSQLQKDIESHLRQAGLKVLRPKNLYKEKGCYGILIRVNGHIFKVGRERVVAYDVHLSIMELVKLRRPTLVPIIPAQTWCYESEIVLTKPSQKAQIDKTVIELVDEFIRDYRYANPP
jgi:hypothetical protein